MLFSISALSQMMIPTIEKDRQFCVKASEMLVSNMDKALEAALVESSNKDKRTIELDDFCFDAQMISHEFMSNQLFSVRRVTDRSRNKDNTIESYEDVLMDEFDYSKDAGSIPVTFWDFWGGSYYFFYYTPITADSSCLGCHGPREQVALEIQRKLDKNYQHDSSYGYEYGDLRGMYVIKIKWPDAKEELSRLLASSDN